MIINIDTSQPISDEDKAALRALIGDGEAAAPAATTTRKTAATKKAVAAPPKAEPEPEKAAEPEPEPEKVAEPEPEGEDSPLRVQAVTLTSEYLQDNQRPKVLRILKEIGAPKASAIPEDRLQEYIDLLSAPDSE